MRRLNGLLVVDKPSGPTSRDVVNRAQKWFPRGTPLGHTGTLDPLASGVLVLCVGQATRLAEYVQQMPKEYESVFLLGHRSNTDDVLGIMKPTAAAQVRDLSAVQHRLDEFIGEFDQVPPAYSAAKVQGRRAYEEARSGRAAVLVARRVRVEGIEILAYQYPRLSIRVVCGKGTYVRALARDLGERLGCGAVVEALRRTRVGSFLANEAISMDATKGEAEQRLLPLTRAVQDLPEAKLSPADVVRFAHGQAVVLDSLSLGDCRRAESSLAVVSESGQLVGIGKWDADHKLVRPLKVLQATE